jgi:hypothetical protein
MSAVEMASGGTIYIPSPMTIGSGIQVILRVLPPDLERFTTDERNSLNT